MNPQTPKRHTPPTLEEAQKDLQRKIEADGNSELEPPTILYQVEPPAPPNEG
jgi:hypothetical protein